jgi:beta-alanine--pyruvate transaminase
MQRVFFTNSGSESADTAIKMALAYHRARGEPSRRIIIGRERGYHGVNVGGTMAGGIPGNRKAFPAMMAGVDHIRSTHDLARNAYSRGLPAHGAEFAGFDVHDQWHDPRMRRGDSLDRCEDPPAC